MAQHLYAKAPASSELRRRRLVAATALGVLGLGLVGLFLSGFGMLLLKLLGGVGPDTGLAIMVAAFAVTDFWGGALVAVAARADRQTAAIAWGSGRAAVLFVMILLIGYSIPIALAQVALAAGAAALGVRVVEPERRELARRLRRHAERVAGGLRDEAPRSRRRLPAAGTVATVRTRRERVRV